MIIITKVIEEVKRQSDIIDYYNSDMNTLGERLKSAREEAGLSQEQLAKLANVKNQSVIGSLETGYRKKSSYVPKIALVLRVEALWLATGEGERYRDAKFENEFEDGPPLPPFKLVPIVGTVQGGDDGYLLEYDTVAGHGDGNIAYPTKDINAYAVRVRGDSMRPRIKSGEFIVVEPNQICMPGDDVVVCLKNGRKMVKEFLYERDEEITLSSINNSHGSITVPSKEIEKMHYVAAIIPRGVFYKPE